VIVGGNVGLSYSGGMWALVGGQWSDLGTSITARAGAAVWFDPATQALGIMGGVTSGGAVDEIVMLSGTTKVDHTPVVPTLVGPLVYDAGRHRPLLFNDSKTWFYDGTWHAIGSSVGPYAGAPRTYDPVRGGVIAYENGVTWQF